MERRNVYRTALEAIPHHLVDESAYAAEAVFEAHEEPEGASFPCPHCEGRGVLRKRKDGKYVAVLCDRCEGEGSRWANAAQIEAASEIGSDNPFCTHDWSSGYDDSSGYEREVAIYCGMCGACGDA